MISRLQNKQNIFLLKRRTSSFSCIKTRHTTIGAHFRCIVVLPVFWISA